MEARKRKWRDAQPRPVPSARVHALQLHVRTHVASWVFTAHPHSFTYVNVDIDSNTHTALASVTVPMVDTLGTPKQGHIALTGNLDEMMVMYVTGTTTTPSVRCVMRMGQAG